MKRIRGEMSRKERLEKYVTRTVTVVVSIGLELYNEEQLSQWTALDVARFGHVVSDKVTRPAKRK